MLETDRLLLLPLDYEQVVKYVKNDYSLEADLQLNHTTRTISPDLLEALEIGILPNVAKKRKNYLYFTLWTLILKSENRMVGDLCFKGEPNIKGEIEIGYGTYDDFQGKGYMTEAVGAMIRWASAQSEVKYILAETEKNNFASFRVLERNEFKMIQEFPNLFLWRRPVKLKQATPKV